MKLKIIGTFIINRGYGAINRRGFLKRYSLLPFIGGLATAGQAEAIKPKLTEDMVVKAANNMSDSPYECYPKSLVAINGFGVKFILARAVRWRQNE